MNEIPLRIRLFMQWLQFWAWFGGILFGVRMGDPSELVELKDEDGENS